MFIEFLPIVGPLFNFLGQEDTNDQNRQINSANNAFNAEQSQINRDFSSTQAQINRDYQERMSNSAYQRATEDMKKAGLNPMLAYSQGGAQTPSGATASGSAAQAQTAIPMQNSIGSAIQAASQLASVQAQIAAVEQTKAQTALTDAQRVYISDEQSKQTHADTLLKTDQSTRVHEEIKLIKAQETSERMKAMLTDADITLRQLDQKFRAGEISYQEYTKRFKSVEADVAELRKFKELNLANAEQSWFKREVSPYVDDLSKISNSASDLLNTLLPSRKIIDMFKHIKLGGAK